MVHTFKSNLKTEPLRITLTLVIIVIIINNNNNNNDNNSNKRDFMILRHFYDFKASLTINIWYFNA